MMQSVFFSTLDAAHDVSMVDDCVEFNFSPFLPGSVCIPCIDSDSDVMHTL